MSREIADLFRQYDVEAIEPVVVQHPEYTMSKAEIGLIALACLVFFGCFLGTVVICITWRQHKKQKKKPKRVPLYAAMNGHANGHRKPNGLTQLSNPLFVDGEMFNESLEIDRVSMNNSRNSSEFRDTESQNLSMDFPTENDPGSMLPQNEFVSSDADGNAVIVVDNEVHRNGTTPGRANHNGQDAWVRPYINNAFSVESIRNRGDRVVATGSMVGDEDGPNSQNVNSRQLHTGNKNGSSESLTSQEGKEGGMIGCVLRMTRRVSPLLDQSVASSYDVPDDPSCNNVHPDIPRQTHMPDGKNHLVSTGAKLGSGRYTTRICNESDLRGEGDVMLYKDHIYNTIPESINHSSNLMSQSVLAKTQKLTAKRPKEYVEIPGSIPSGTNDNSRGSLAVVREEHVEKPLQCSKILWDDSQPRAVALPVTSSDELVQYSSHLVQQGPQNPMPKGCWEKSQSQHDPKNKPKVKRVTYEMADTYF